MTAQPQASYWNGAWGGRGQTLEVVNPADESVVAKIATVTVADMREALDSASAALEQWRVTDPWTRSRLLRAMAEYIRDHQPKIAASITAEQGKPMAQAEGEVAASADHFDWCADESRRIYGRSIPARDRGRRLLVQREPVGVVGAFSASNFPCLLPARKIAAAVAAGCTVVAKPAEDAPSAALWLTQAADSVGLPPGVLNVVVGDPQTISDVILDDRRVRKITLTGSIPLGQRIMARAAEDLKSVSLELGGHAPVVVLDDADPHWAGSISARGKFRNAGQVCIAPSRFLVPAAIHREYVGSFVRTAASLHLGPGHDASCDLGPLQSQGRLEEVERLVAAAVEEGARIELGGRRAHRDGPGWWYEPTVLTGVRDDAAIMGTEPFGPIAPILAYDTLEAAIDLANSVDFGLAGFVLGESLRRCLDVADRLEVGMVGINEFAVALAEAPFGGIKHSGFGREGGTEGITEFTVSKYINIGP